MSSGAPVVGSDYKFNGIEHIDDLGLNLHLADYRAYDALIGRWTGVDPLAEKYHSHSSYHAHLGNPVKYVDYDGREPWITITPYAKGGGKILISTHVFVNGLNMSRSWAGRITEEMNKIKSLKNRHGYFLNSRTNELEKWDVEFDFQFIYNSSATRSSLKDGENLIVYGVGNMSHIEGSSDYSYENVYGIDRYLLGVGNYGEISANSHPSYGYWTSIHETFHLAGLLDRYWSPNRNRFGNWEQQFEVGFENDLLGKAAIPLENTNFNQAHIDNYIEMALYFSQKNNSSHFVLKYEADSPSIYETRPLYGFQGSITHNPTRTMRSNPIPNLPTINSLVKY